MAAETKRYSNIELLRVVSMLLIISFHYAYKGGFTDDIPLINGYIIKMFWMFGELGYLIIDNGDLSDRSRDRSYKTEPVEKDS